MGEESGVEQTAAGEPGPGEQQETESGVDGIRRGVDAREGGSLPAVPSFLPVEVTGEVPAARGSAVAEVCLVSP